MFYEWLIEVLRSTLRRIGVLGGSPSPAALPREAGTPLRSLPAATESPSRRKPCSSARAQNSAPIPASSGRRTWVIFRWLPDERLWGAVSSYESYADVHVALRQKERFESGTGSPDMVRVVGFASPYVVRTRAKADELIGQGSVYLFSRGGATTPACVKPQPTHHQSPSMSPAFGQTEIRDARGSSRRERGLCLQGVYREGQETAERMSVGGRELSPVERPYV